jgi:hypothetical protein
MKLESIETMFNRAFFSSFDRKKIFWTFSTLLLCTSIFVLIHALIPNSSGWTLLSILFIPLFISLGLLFSLGIFLSRVYYNERLGRSCSYREIILKSFKLLAGGAYFMIPFLLVYFILWSFFGIFHALGQIPTIGTFISVILAFAPFLVLVSSIALILLGVVLLFTCAPWLALQEQLHISMLLSIKESFKRYFLSYCMFIVLGLLPLVLGGGLCICAAHTTVTLVFQSQQVFSFQFIFILIPLCALLAPCVISFFHFGVEAYNALQKREKSVQ